MYNLESTNRKVLLTFACTVKKKKSLRLLSPLCTDCALHENAQISYANSVPCDASPPYVTSCHSSQLQCIFSIATRASLPYRDLSETELEAILQAYEV